MVELLEFTEDDFDIVTDSRDIRVNIATGNLSETDMEVCRPSTSNSLASSGSPMTPENDRVVFKIKINTPNGVSNGQLNHPQGHPPVGPPIGGWGMGGPYGPHSMQAFSKRCAQIYFSFSNQSDTSVTIGKWYIKNIYFTVVENN